MAERAYTVFTTLQNQLTWVDPNSMTKTAYLYSRAGIRS